MGLRFLLNLWILGTFLLVKASADRFRRQANHNSPYQPPLLLRAPPPPAPIVSIQNSYNPPIPLGRSIDSSANIPRSQPEYSYIPSILPSNGHPINYHHEPITPSAATSYSVHQQPALSEASGRHQSSAETHSKAISHVPVQSIHKAPASEIQAEKGPAAKEKDNKNDEYVVYYYYYYDNDTTPNNNLSLNFDDIPSLESYDEDKSVKEPQKSASARTLATNINSVVPISEEPHSSHSGSSQPRSASGPNKDTVIKSDRTDNFDDTVVQPLKPVSNVFRYGANEVPRFPVLPNFIVSEIPTTTKASEVVTPLSVTSEHSFTQVPSVNSPFPNLAVDEDEDDAVNNVLDNASLLKSDDKSVEEEVYTTTVSTTDAPTTTEPPTTTTERPSRRRPSVSGGRRRFNQSPSSFSSTRTRAPASVRSSTSSTTSTTTSTTSPPTRRSFQSNSNRVRPRPSINTNRGRTNSRTTESSDDSDSASPASESTTQSSTTSRSRFTSAPSRRFQSSRSRAQTSSTTSSTSRPSTSSQSSVRPRPTPASRRPIPVSSRGRPARPGFLRPRPGSEPEVTETTTPEPEETSPAVSKDEVSSDADIESSSEEEEETSEEPTTTEASRFSALFRPRNRNALGNRPRPVIGNRPSRS